MPRKRTNTPAHWPPRWRRHHGAIYYQVPPGSEDEWDGRKSFRLGKTEPEAWVMWYSRLNEPIDGAPRTIGEAIDRYCAEVLHEKSKRTQQDYLDAFKRLRAVFGHMPPSLVKPKHVYQYMDKRPKVRGNREKAALSALMTECVRWGAIDRNLVREVRRNKEVPRDRYVEDAELEAFKEFASPMLRAYIEIRMLTGLRQGQILDLKRTDWDGDRLKATGVKAGRKVIYRGEGLTEAVNALLTLNAEKAVRSIYLLSSRNGTRYTGDGFRSIWHRTMKKYIDATGAESFAENDLRAKVASGSADLVTASTRLGHQSETTTKRFFRRRPATIHVLSPGEDAGL